MVTPTDPTLTVSATAPVTATTATIFDEFDELGPTNTTVAMTTAFSMPSGCLNFNGAELNVHGAYQSSQGTTELTQNLQDMAAPSCWPDGEFHGTYSPGVCPSGWTYYSIIPGDYTEPVLNTVSVSGPSTEYWSTVAYYTNQVSAYCCPSGFSMAIQTWSMDAHFQHVCSRTVTSGESTIAVTNRTDGATMVFKGSATLVIPTPMTIFWHAADAPSLTPRPPDIPSYSFAPSWVPGQSVVVYDKIQYDDSPRSNRLATGVFAVVIAVPIIIFLAILGCCICCFRIRRKREKRAIAKEQEESQALAVERTSTQENTPNHSTDGDPEAARQQGRGSEATAAAASSSATARQVSSDIQRPAAEDPAAGNTVVHPLSNISKPPYPGLPSEGFDGIEEPPPYAEAAPSYPISRGPAAGPPTSPT